MLVFEVLTVADCLKSLHFPSFTLRQDTARDATSGTFEWIWSAKDSCFEKWLQSRSGIFWISGKPGSGKTTMVKYLIANRGRIEELQTSLYSEQTVTQAIQRSRGNRDLILAAHFFDHEGDHLTHSVTGLLRSLLFQLLRARPQLFEAILPRYEEMKRFHTAIVWSFRDLNVAFKAMLRHSECGPVMFFIDALDEAEDEHDEIIRLITGFSEVSSKDTQFCVSSRPSADFSFYLADPEAKIRLDEYSSQDIHHFVRESFQELASRFNTNYGNLINQIALKAENVFLWARLVVEDLLRAARRREAVEILLHRLLKMPTQLNYFYRRMVDQASDYERSEVLQILGIVLSALEPLSIEQLQDVMEHCSNQDARQELCPGAQQSFHSSLNSAEHFAERIESICFGLVEVRTTYHHKEMRREVAFSHHTVNEFLETLDDESETQGRTKLTVQGNLDLLSACVDCMVAVNTSDFFRVISIDDEQLRRQNLVGENTSSASKLEWPRIENQCSWTEAELNVQAFVICPFLRYAASHWAQHASAIEFEIGTSCHTILSKLTPINFRLWSLLMRRSDESWNGIEGRQIVTPSTLLEYATLFGLTNFVEEELQSSLTNTSKTSQLKEHQFLDLKMIYGRLLYAAATGGNVVIAEALMVWGAKFGTNLRCMPDALSRAIFRGNLDVASVFCDHGALSNVPGVYLEGFKIQSQYRTTDILTMRIADRPSQLEATPMALMASVNNSKYTPMRMFSKCADFDTTTTPASSDYIARLTEWDPEIAIDDFAVAFNSPCRNVRSAVMTIDQYTGDAIPKQRHDKEQQTYVLDEDTEWAQDGGSIRLHVLTVKLLPIQDIENSLVMLMKYKGAYGRLPKLNITPFNLTSSVSLDLTKRLLDLGYSLFEHHRPLTIFRGPFSMKRPIPCLADEEAFWNSF